MSQLDDLIAAHTSGRLGRRTFVRRLLALGVGMGFVEPLLRTSVKRTLAAPLPRSVPSRTPYVVLVVMDAFRADYQKLAPMHHLHRLIDRGTYYPHAWVGHLESNTVPSHATIATGATPAHQGVIGFSWRDPATGEETYTGWYKDVLAGRLEQQLLQHGVTSIAEAMKVADPTARAVAVSSEKYYAADAIGGHAADYILYGHVEGDAIVSRGIPHHTPPEQFLRGHAFSGPWPPRSYEQLDEFSMTMALASLSAFDPRILLVNLPAADYYGHQVGGPATPGVMAEVVSGCDRQLGRLIKALHDRGILDQTLFVVTGDHGMVPNTYRIDDSGIKQAIRFAGGQYLFHTGRNAAYIWLGNPSVARQVAQHLVDTIPHAPFAYCQSLASGTYAFQSVARTGESIEPALDAAYRYLLGTFAGPLAPDITLAFEENTIITSTAEPHGEHSGATWGTQQVPLVIAGPGIAKGRQSQFPARLMDIAPTLLTLLGIQPAHADGVVLADALVAPTKSQETAQGDLAPALTAYQRALVARSEADIVAQRAPAHGARQR